jgi:hypothetical protein
MIPNSCKPDISNLVRRGHFYFGLTSNPKVVDRLIDIRYTMGFILTFPGLHPWGGRPAVFYESDYDHLS